MSTTPGNTVPSERKIKVVLRYDDYAGEKPTDVEKELISIAESRGVAFTFGVIPCVEGKGMLGTEAIAGLTRAIGTGKIEIAQHGWSHEAVTSWRGVPSEFGGVDRDEQFARLKKGKEYLENILGRKVETFIPPWNSYDAATVACLDQLGFKLLSADWRETGWETARISPVPMTCELGLLRNVIEEARRDGQEEVVIVSLFHGYDFREINPEKGWFSLPELKELVDWLKLQPDIRLLTVSQAAAEHPEFDGKHQGFVSRWIHVERLIPPFLRSSHYHRLIYPGVKNVHRRIRAATAKLAACFLLVAAFAGMGAWIIEQMILNKFPALRPVGLGMLFALVIGALVYNCRAGSFHWRKLIALAGAVGLVAGYFF